MKQIQPTLIIGLGGTGTLALSEIKKLANQYYLDPRYSFPLLRFLAIDTEFVSAPSPETIKKRYARDGADLSEADSSYEETHEIALDTTERVLIAASPTLVQEWLTKPEDLEAGDFVDPNHMQRVIEGVRGNGAGGFGIVGKLSLWHHLGPVHDKLRHILIDLNNAQTISEQLQAGYAETYSLHQDANHLNVFIIGSVGGGTGRGTFLPIAVMLREILHRMDVGIFENAQRYLVNYLPSCFQVSGRNVGQSYIGTIESNQYAAHKELEYALKHGYPVENKLRALFTIADPDYRSKDILTDILEIAAQKDPGGQYVGDYATINRAVAETILGYTFGGLVGNIRTYFRANKGSYIAQNDLRENAAPGVKRRRDFGRIGRYRLTLPVNQLFRYAKCHYAREIFDDMVRGHLWSGEEARPQAVAEARSATFIADAAKTLSDLQHIFFSTADVQASCTNFDDNWASAIQELTDGKGQTLNSMFSKGPDGEELRASRERTTVAVHLNGGDGGDGGINGVLKQYVRWYGLRQAREVVSAIIDDGEIALRSELKPYVAEYNDRRRKKTPGAADEELSLASNAGALLNLLIELRDARVARLAEFAGGTAPQFATLNTTLNAEAQRWTQHNDTLFKNWGIKEKTPKRLSLGGQQAVDDVVKAARKAFNDLFDVSRHASMLATHLRMADELRKRLAVIDANIAVLDSRSESGLGLIEVYKQKARDIVAEKRDSLETRVTGNTEGEFATFAREIRFAGGETIPQRVQAHLDAAWMSQLVEGVLTREEIEEVVTREVSAIDELQGNYSVSSYLRRTPTKVRNILAALVDNASLLGKLDPGKLRGAPTNPGLRKPLVQTSEPELIEQHAIAWGGQPVDVVPYAGREAIILTTFETALPQAAFRELHECQTRFFQNAQSESGRHERHTSSRFVSLQEPIGSSAHLSVEEIGPLVNFLRHLGVMRIDASGFVQRSASEFHDAAASYKPFLDERRLGLGGTERDSLVSLDSYIALLNDNASWFDDFAELTRKRLRIIFAKASPESGKEYLRRYFEWEEASQFPVIPHSVIAYIRHSDDDTTPQHMLGEFVKDLELRAETKRRRFVKDPVLTQLYRTDTELAGAFASPDPSHFMRTGAAPVAATSGGTLCACGTEVGPGARFCSACGSAAPAPTVSGTCRACGKPHDVAARFCPSCGAATSPASGCLNCGAPLDPAARFCSACGHPVGTPVGAP